MKYSLFLILFAIPFSVCSQVQFAIVCNQKTFQLEVVVDGRQTRDQKTLKGGFPNQASAERFKNTNTSSLNCVNPSSPQSPNTQPTRSGPPPRATTNTINSNQNAQSPSQNNSDGYNRSVMIIGTATSALGTSDLYFTQGAQNLGYNVGIKILLGKQTKWGLGVQYASLIGTFESVVLDFNFGDEGATHAFRTELFGLYPFELANDNWFYISLGAAYYLSHRSNTGLDNEELTPQPRSQFFGGAIDLGFDIKGFNIGVGIELTGDILEFQSSGIQLIRLFTGFNF